MFTSTTAAIPVLKRCPVPKWDHLKSTVNSRTFFVIQAETTYTQRFKQPNMPVYIRMYPHN